MLVFRNKVDIKINYPIENFSKKEKIIYFDIETTGILEIQPEEKTLPIEPQKTKREKKLTPREQQMNRPLFEDNYQKYEWLMAHGCTSSDDRKWLAAFIRSDEYINIYGD